MKVSQKNTGLVFASDSGEFQYMLSCVLNLLLTKISIHDLKRKHIETVFN